MVKNNYVPTSFEEAKTNGISAVKDVYGCVRKGYIYEGYFHFTEQAADKIYTTKILARYCQDRRMILNDTSRCIQD